MGNIRLVFSKAGLNKVIKHELSKTSRYKEKEFDVNVIQVKEYPSDKNGIFVDIEINDDYANVPIGGEYCWLIMDDHCE